MKKNFNCAPLIYVWLGTQLPKWVIESISFSRINNKEREIILIINKKINRKLHINLSNINIKLFYLNLKEIHSNIEKSNTLNKSNNFWLFTSLRFEVLNYFIQKNNIDSFFHAEIDNLLFNFDDLDDKFNQIGQGIFVPRDGKNRAIASFIYCNRKSCLDELLSLYSSPFNPENDMQALGIYANQSKHFFSLPTESYEFTKRIWKIILPEITKGLFDAAAIGQYCLGTDPRNNKYQPTFNLFKNEFSKVNFEELEIVSNGFQLFLRSSKKIKFSKLYNIHVHSKDINKAISMIKKDKFYESLVKKQKFLVAHRYKIILGIFLKIFDIFLSRIKKFIKFILNANNIKIKKKNF